MRKGERPETDEHNQHVKSDPMEADARNNLTSYSQSEALDSFGYFFPEIHSTT